MSRVEREEDLPPEIQSLLGIACAEEPCDQCAPHPNVTCQLTRNGKAPVWIPAQVVNAERGNLIMVPGDGDGTIGALLASLEPSQHYTHMGIMIRDRFTIRHCTGSADYLKAHPNEGAPPYLGNPTDGFREDALRYGWPGAVTQPVEVAYRASRGQSDGALVEYLGAASGLPGLSVQVPSAKKDSTVLGDPLAVEGIDFEPVMAPVAQHGDALAVVNAILSGAGASSLEQLARNATNVTWQMFWPLVVKPCVHRGSDEVRAALDRVAAAAESLPGHYRFHAYVDAQIAEKKAYFGLPQTEVQLPDPDRPCGPKVQWDHSLPMVCSTFIWEAVQEANRRGAPRIFLTHPTDRGTPHCVPFYLPPPGDVLDPTDGLCDYDPRQTARAALALAAALKRGIAEAESAAPWYLSWLGDLYEWFSDMQDDVSNQVCNAFAFDHCDPETACDDDSWHNAPPSVSVSPDNIIRSWMEPTDIGDGDLHGLYGYNEQAILRPGHFKLARSRAWTFSRGPGFIEGHVRYKGKPAAGARVTVACRSEAANADGFYHLEVPEGRYLLEGGVYLPQPGNQPAWYAEGDMEIEARFGSTDSMPVLELQDPPGANRIVQITGKADLVNRHTFGKDWWDHPAMNFALIHLGEYFTAEGNENSSHWGATIDSSYVVDVTVTAKRLAPKPGDQYPVGVHVKAALGSKGISGWPFTPEAVEEFDADVGTDGSASWTVDLKSGALAPVRSHLAFTIANFRQG